jgi:hypothetical protein
MKHDEVARTGGELGLIGLRLRDRLLLQLPQVIRHSRQLQGAQRKPERPQQHARRLVRSWWLSWKNSIVTRARSWSRPRLRRGTASTPSKRMIRAGSVSRVPSG